MEVKQALDLAGGPAALARACGVTPGAVSQWIKSGRLPEMRQWQLKVQRPEWFAVKRKPEVCLSA